MDQRGNGHAASGPNGSERSLKGYVRGPKDQLRPKDFATGVTPARPSQPDPPPPYESSVSHGGKS
jgi:hypothetical protein